MTTSQITRCISIVLTLVFFFVSLPLSSHDAQANDQKQRRPYRTHFSKEWSAQAELPKIQIWKHSESSSSLVSATIHPLASSSENAVTPNGVLHKSEGPIPLKDLEGFLKSRAAKMNKVGLRNWNVEKAETRVLSSSLRAMDFYGTYLGASGAHFCFRERQVNLKKMILQITATRKQQKDHCDWAALTRWLEYVTPEND